MIEIVNEACGSGWYGAGFVPKVSALPHCIHTG